MKDLLLILILSFAWPALAAENVITMGYRSTEKLPYIEVSPSNEGFYKEGSTRKLYKQYFE